MYRKEKKIPTLVALLLLIVGIGTAVTLDRSSQSLTSSASPTSHPQEIHFTNITDNSFTVSWLTASAIIGSITVSNNSETFTYLDDLDSDNIPRPRNTHYITVKNLKEDNSYKVKIISGKNNCPDENSCPVFTQKTVPRLINSLTLPPAHGSILTNENKPAEGAVAYLLVGKSSILSGRVDSSGLWVIPFNHLRTQDLQNRPEIGDNDLIQITVNLSPTQATTAIIDVKSIRQNLTIPPMTIGNSYNFIALLGKKDFLAARNMQTNILGIKTENTNTPSYKNLTPTIKQSLSPQTQQLQKIDILFPKNDQDTTPDDRPRIRGYGPAGSQLLITVNSTPQTGTVTVGKDGTWTWRPEKALPPGIHFLNIQTNDGKGNLITVTREFIVLKSGESVLGESTPSASLTPTSKPSITATPAITSSLSPTISISPSPSLQPTIILTTQPTYPPTDIPPRSGSTGITLLTIGISLIFLIFGARLLNTNG
ncbi:hypothetical protein A2960_04740 [Candidatus Gottesmanbacteria bacterium RIFCSPLOWO2_01_FULL_39_12b]|uniref:Fibronectin type-III domain-containing protein n=1 Tax=Candidatus Gottesmanbacteria bacterium RIFCSPLOWO2_01_FULL_39_12b TaxID=1798388 RepID=A0A1F6ANJ4_9BACT|nr:MAG: hypothetical protein A2960_04740 [Candidatus Gottesmanbacteria bacterium RIFCSPLOWO2_01_FULL_39_12b]